MIANPEKLFDKFAKVQNQNLMNIPVWQKYRQDYLDYFSLFEGSEEYQEFGNFIFYPCLGDDLPSTPLDKSYFYQDTWASRKIFQHKPQSVVDIGSTVLYAGIISQFVPTTFVDIRPVNLNLPGLTVVAGSILDLPFEDASQSFVTSLCVLEHIGLGRYGDPIMPDGTRRACTEIDRILKPGGQVIVSVPVGYPCIAFNAHRIFSKDQFLSYFPGYQVLDEVYLTPEPAGAEALATLDIGESVVWVVHLSKGRNIEVEKPIEQGRAVPPPHKVKQETVQLFAKNFSVNTLVETGTYLGDMVFAMKDLFKKIISIELGQALYLEAKKRFSTFSHIEIIQGDSSKVLPTVLAQIEEPCLFWLDGHYSEGITAKGDLETPILQELEAIFTHPIKNHIILIDDARCFTGNNDYPTIEQLKEFVAKYNPNHVFEIRDDIIRISPVPPSNNQQELTTVGTNNESARVAWLKQKLSQIPANYRILDAGAGEQQFKKFCSHLNYVAQDFGKYDGSGDCKGLQMGAWNQTQLDIVCDIAAIPEPDASFDAILCTEVFEHLPNPLLALKEFSRLCRSGGQLIITAPFCSLTHFAPYHFYSGFNRYFYENQLPAYGFKIIELQENGNFFEYLAQEIHRINYVADRYAQDAPTSCETAALSLVLKMLKRFTNKNKGSEELLCFGYHAVAQKI